VNEGNWNEPQGLIPQSARACKEAISGLIEAGIDWQMVGICVDDRPADLLMEIGHMDHEVRKAIEAGLDPLSPTSLQL